MISSIDHVVILVEDLDAGIRQYRDMGFTVVPGGKHPRFTHNALVSFADGSYLELIAFWDFHDPDLPEGWRTAISEDLGLPLWANHLAFAADGLADLAARRKRWLDHGVDVLEIDHVWCTSIYATDPNGILVEFCTTTQPFGAEARAEAARLLADPSPARPSEQPRTQLHRAKDHRG